MEHDRPLSTALPDPTSHLPFARTWVDADLALAESFLTEPGVHYLCSPPRGQQPTLIRERLALKKAAIAVDAGGDVQAAAWLEMPDEPGTAAVGLLVVRQHRERFGDAAHLLALLASEAVQEGVERIVTCVPGDSVEPLKEFRTAGLRVVSKLNIGGSVEVVLERGAR